MTTGGVFSLVACAGLERSEAMRRRLALIGLLVWTLWHFDPNNRWYQYATYETEAECGGVPLDVEIDSSPLPVPLSQVLR